MIPVSPIAIIDFEASCLPNDGLSYPIEVAVARVGGSSRSWLIKPSPRWFYWDWSEEAGALHGISPAMLKTRGIAAVQVLDELAREVEGCRVYADSDLDSYWLETLAEACGRPLPFPILYLGELFHEMRTNSAAIERAEEVALTRLPQEHVARNDARRLAITVELLSAA
jgi:hypothetical protein